MNKLNLARDKRLDKKVMTDRDLRKLNIDIERYCGEIKSQDEIFEMYRQFDKDYMLARESNPNLTKAEFRRNYTKMNLDNLFRCLNSLNKKQDISTECNQDDLNLVMKALSLVNNPSKGGAKRARSKSTSRAKRQNIPQVVEPTIDEKEALQVVEPTIDEEEALQVVEATIDEKEAPKALAEFYLYSILPNKPDLAALTTTVKRKLTRGAEIFNNFGNCAQNFMSYAWATASGLLKNTRENERVTEIIESTKQKLSSISLYVIAVSYIGNTGIPQDILKILYTIFTSSVGISILKHTVGLTATLIVAREIYLRKELSDALDELKRKINNMTNTTEVQTILSYIKTLNLFKSAAELQEAKTQNELELLKTAMESVQNERQQTAELNTMKKELSNELDQLNEMLEESISTTARITDAKKRRSSLKKTVTEQKETAGGKRHTKKRLLNKQITKHTKTYRK